MRSFRRQGNEKRIVVGLSSSHFFMDTMRSTFKQIYVLYLRSKVFFSTSLTGSIFILFITHYRIKFYSLDHMCNDYMR